MRMRCLAVLLLFACGPKVTGTGPVDSREALKGLPAHQDPPLALDDDDDLDRARQLYDALPADDSGRAAQREALWEGGYRPRIERALASGARDDAFDAYQSALEMWDASEIGLAAVPDIQLIAPTARIIYDQFAPTGGDRAAITALIVLMAAEPTKVAKYRSLYTDIAAYSDDLAMAEHGPGAQRMRPIELLEDATSHFPLPWACEELIKLYLERQDVLNTAITKGERAEPLAVHGDGILRPVYNLIRAYARMGKIDLAPDVIDRLAGQAGDDPELRRALRAALAPDAKGQAWSKLVGFLLDSSRSDGEAEGMMLVRRLCEDGARRLPTAPEPRFCVGYIAFRQQKVPLAIRWLESDLRIQPKDQDVSQILAISYLARLGDYLISERTDAARAQLAQLEAFHADAKARLAKPLEPSLTEAWMTMGRGLYNQGAIDEAAGYLAKVQAVKPNADALEFLANIAMKRGDYAAAARDYAAAAALPRDAPLEQLVDRARLRRLAGEAYTAGGDSKQAAGLFQEALDEWERVLAAQITPPQTANAMFERGRVLYHVGETDKAILSIMKAVDVAGRAGVVSIYSDAIAWFTARGIYEPAVDVYLRALAEHGGSEYFKIYPSLWIVGLSGIHGVDAPPLAIDFLKARQGTRWYHDLARFVVGDLGFEAIYAKANTRGKRAEAFFYEAMRRFGKGETEDGRRYLLLVLETDMFGFYEYDMAAHMLKHGAGVKK